MSCDPSSNIHIRTSTRKIRTKRNEHDIGDLLRGFKDESNGSEDGSKPENDDIEWLTASGPRNQPPPTVLLGLSSTGINLLGRARPLEELPQVRATSPFSARHDLYEKQSLPFHELGWGCDI